MPIFRAMATAPRSPRLRPIVAATIAAFSVVAMGDPAGAGSVAPAPTAAPPVTARPSTTVTALQLDQVDARLLTQVEAEVGSARADLAAAQAADLAAQASDDTATGAAAQKVALLDHLNDSERRDAAAVIAARAALKRVAVAAYESGGPSQPMAALLSSGTIGEFAHRQAYVTVAADETATALHDYVVARDETDRATRRAVAEVQRAQAAKAAAELTLARTRASLEAATSALRDREGLLVLTGDALSTPDTDIPRMVLDAYQRAALAVQARGCRLQWWGLAGIGRVESDHGRAQHARLAPNGDLVPHIVGVPLTGQNGTALVVDPSGDFAHAEGPMQFIPSTWARWGQDGNGDGQKSPDNIYDASLAAAMYLCAASKALDGDAGLQAAYLSYNHSADYVTEVLAFAHSYESAELSGLVPPVAAQPMYQPSGPSTGAGR